jgi:bifunctional DNA-binding transcriptional regulator/antitoxin component of YhaV-PrlF toxin-antitoxin module
MAEKQTFKTELIKSGDSEATWIELPFDVEEVFGTKRAKVKIWINGAEYRGSAVRMGSECYMVGVPKVFRDAAGIKAGDSLEVTLERDDDPRIVTLTDDLAQSIDKAGVSGAWDKLSYTHQKENARDVGSTKGAALRAKKIDKIILMLQSIEIGKK